MMMKTGPLRRSLTSSSTTGEQLSLDTEKGPLPTALYQGSGEGAFVCLRGSQGPLRGLLYGLLGGVLEVEGDPVEFVVRDGFEL